MGGGGNVSPPASTVPPLRSGECLHVQLQQVANATLVLIVDEVLAVVEAALFVATLAGGFALGHRHLLAIQRDGGVLRWV